MKTTTAAGREAWSLSNGEVAINLTVVGGQMAPVTFYADTENPVEPYYVSPWQEEMTEVPGPGVLGPLRGDFFCLPFGGDNEFGGETHPPHGEVSEAPWTLLNATDGSDSPDGTVCIETEMITRIRPGRIVKRIEIRQGQQAVYVSHRIEDFPGPVTIGNHAIMRGDRTCYIDTPPLICGYTDIAPPSPYAAGEYSCLEPGTFFGNLAEVPTIWKDPAVTDCRVFPSREGFVDILQLCPDYPENGNPGWTTITVPEMGYLWFSIKDPEILPSTLLWMENRGRHGAPWNGRNSCLGVEEVLAHQAAGLKLSAQPNALTKRGIPTSRVLTGDQPFSVKYIQGVCRISERFDRVSGVEFESGLVRFTSRSGEKTEAAVDWAFVMETS